MSEILRAAKGNFAEALLAGLLEAAGYRVARFGIENTIAEIRSGEPELRQALEIPPEVWTIPDLLVLDYSIPEALLVEVKFRSRLEKRELSTLKKKLEQQWDLWPSTLVAIIVANPPGGTRGRYQDHLRFVDADNADLLDPSDAAGSWSSLATIGSLFPLVHETPEFHADADRLLPVIQAWGQL